MKRRIAVVTMLVAAGIIAGCGGSDDGTGAMDDFIGFVKSMVATSSETAEPVSVDDVVADNSDTAEPIAVY